MVRHGRNGEARQGVAWYGAALHGRRGYAWQGAVWPGVARFGEAGMTWGGPAMHFAFVAHTFDGDDEHARR